MGDRPKLIEVNGNCEWLVDYSNIDFDRIDECDYEEAAETFVEKLHEYLAEEGFVTVPAEGDRTNCDSWNSNVYTTVLGPCGSFDEFGRGSATSVYEAIGKAQAAMNAAWATDAE